MRCEKCGEVHERCAAHVKNGARKGKPCRRWPARGMTVCRQCGGGAPQVKQAGERRRAEAAAVARARLYLAEQGVEAVADPLAALCDHVAQVRAFYAFVHGQVGRMAAGGWETRDAKGTTQLSVYVELLERAQDRTLLALSELVKLGFEERLVAITERQAAMVVAVIDRVLEAVEVSEQQRALARAEVPRFLELVAAEGCDG